MISALSITKRNGDNQDCKCYPTNKIQIHSFYLCILMLRELAGWLAEELCNFLLSGDWSRDHRASTHSKFGRIGCRHTRVLTVSSLYSSDFLTRLNSRPMALLLTITTASRMNRSAAGKNMRTGRIPFALEKD
jgi:hypothetical protein